MSLFSGSRPALPLAAAGLAALLLSPPGLAQIEEIVVTARKVEERLTDVPIAVEAFSADVIERRGLRNMADITRQSASLIFDQGSALSDTRIAIRGLSPSRGRQNAALLVDGIDVSSEAVTSSGGSILFNQRLLDVERIEVLKGPQIALYGRSAFNGAIQFVTKNPSEEFEAELNSDLNIEDQYSLSGSVSGPIFGELLGARVNATWWDEEGFHRNSLSGDKLGGSKGYGFSVTTRSDFGERFSLRGRAEYTRAESQPAAEAFLPFNTALVMPAEARTLRPGDLRPVLECLPDTLRSLAGPDPADPRLLWADLLEAGPALMDRYRLISADPANPVSGGGGHCQNQIPFFVGKIPDGKDLTIVQSTNPFTPGKDFRGVESDTVRLSLIANWDFDRATLSSWTGYTRDDNVENLDLGKFGVLDPTSPYRDSNAFVFLYDNDKLTRQFSQELRIRTRYDGPVNATVGGVYWSETVNNRSNSNPLQSAGSYCFYNSVLGTEFGAFFPAPGCPGYNEIPISALVAGGFNFLDGQPYEGIQQYREPSPADRDTDHRSIYGMLEFDLTPSLTLTLEGRYSYETVEVAGPRFLFPGAAGGPGGATFCGFPGAPCTEDFLFRPGGPFSSLAAFEAFYDQWNPVTNTTLGAATLGNFWRTATGPGGTLVPDTLVGLIPEVCRNDPAVQQRIARAEQGINDFDFFHPYCIERISRNDKWFSPKMTVSWKPSDDSLLYAYWARAEKPGGFSTLTIGSSGLVRDIAEFEPEKMEVWEIGGNITTLNRTLRLSGAVFFQDYTDKQVLAQTLGPDGRPVSRIENASAAEVWGAEIEVLWRPAREFLGGDWAASASYSWLSTEYVRFVDNSTSENNIALSGVCGEASITNEILGTTRPACAISYSGNKLEKAPRHAVVSNLAYTRALPRDLEMLVALDTQWTGRRYVEFSNESWLASYWNTDLQFGLQTRRWQVLGYVTNLFDDDTVRSASSGPGLSCCFQLGVAVDFGRTSEAVTRDGTPYTAASNSEGSGAEVPIPKAAFLPPPRVIGVRLKYRFGAAAY